MDLHPNVSQVYWEVADMITDNLRIVLYGAFPRQLRHFWDRIEASDLGTRIAGGALWSVCGAVISRGLMLAASILVARILGREVYGEYGILRSTVNMFLVFAGFSLGMTATKHVAELRTSDPMRAGRIIAISGLFAMVTGTFVSLSLYIFAPWVAANTINAPHLADDLQIGSLILFFNALNGAQTGALAGFEAFKTIAIVNLGVGLLSFPLLVGGAYYGGLSGAVWALAGNVSINWIINHLSLRRCAASHQIPFSLKGCIAEWPLLLKFSLPAALGGVMVSPIVWVCNTMLVNQPGGYGQMALIDAANQWQSVILFVPSLVGQIILPILSNLNGEYNKDRYRAALKYNVLLNGGLVLFFALPVAIFSPLLMRIYGLQFEPGYLALTLLSFSTILIALNNVVGQAIASKGQMWIGFLFNLMWAAVLLILSRFFVSNGYGATGLAAAYLISYLAHSIWQSTYVLKVFVLAKRSS